MNTYVALDSSGIYCGTVQIEPYKDGSPPAVVRDQHGTTWTLRRRGKYQRLGFYERTPCAEAFFLVKP